MVSWDKAKGSAGTGTQRREVQRLTLDIGDNKLRLIGDVLPRYVYWTTTNEGKKMPVECLRFNRQTEQFDDKQPDPFKELDESIWSDKPQFAYVCNAIDRRDNQVKLFDLKSTIYRQIVDYASNPEYGNPADSKSGYDITVKKEKTGPLPQNVKYTCIPTRASVSLTKEEEELEKYDLDRIYKRQTYDEQKQWLLQNTAYFAGEAGDEANPIEESVEDLD